MKTHILFFLISFFSALNIKAQTKGDTLFFSIDKYYTISPTITPNPSKQIYAEQVKAERKQMKHTKTNGYVYFIGNGSLIKGLQPKKIMSLKNYIENRKFYFDGTHNKIVDRQKLEDSLTNKYEIFFVKGDKFIKPRHLEYTSYYPTRDKNWNVIDNRVKDTLFFKLDNQYLYESEVTTNWYLIKDSSKNEYFCLKGGEKVQDLKPGKILSFKEFVQSSRFYKKEKKEREKLKDNELADFLSNYIVFLVKDIDNKTEFIPADSTIITED
ncbi:hypothetical protein [Flavobacterium poyangense]|uniref:hypothetical protein n=1 Tax=Flavobacterium poyangense TaxID=2204302 RepID=UPI00142326D5|nr:hypothetical protein [Flavobacterium sp. JXAS1]